MIVSSSISAGSHREHVSGIWHLVINAAEGGGHFVGERARYDHEVRLARSGAKNDAEAIHVVARRREVHHLHCAASQAEYGKLVALLAPKIRPATGVVVIRSRVFGISDHSANFFEFKSLV